jgi:acyl carrier protein
MNQDELRAVVLATLTGIAPEVEPDDIQSARSLRDQVDLDSMDWLNFLIGLKERLGVDIPEADYRNLATLDAIIAYLATKLRA